MLFCRLSGTLLKASDGLSKLYGDDLRIRQVLVNLLTNAVKYTRKGTVSFEVTGERDGADVVLTQREEETGALAVNALHMQICVHQFEKLQGNIHTQTRPLNIAVFLLVNPLERREQFRNILLSDTNARMQGVSRPYPAEAL
mgnify:CR=1 FL=1